jgi:hypothetical protein
MAKQRLIGTVVTPEGKRFDVKILTAAQSRKAFKPYGALIGYVAFAWNRLHENLSILFQMAVKPETPLVAPAIWYTTDNDFIQRKMLRVAIQQTHHLSANQRQDMLYILNTIDESLRHKRNDALHAPLMLTRGVIDDTVATWAEANIWSQSPRAKALLNKNLLREFEEYGDLADMLSDYAAHMCQSLMFPDRHPWPKRPAVPSAHKKKGNSRRGRAKVPSHLR